MTVFPLALFEGAPIDGPEIIVYNSIKLPLVFPSGPQYAYPIRKKPTFSTIIQTSKSGREVGSNQQLYPLWEYILAYDILRDQTQNQELISYFLGYTEYSQLVSFFLSCNGPYGRFLFDDLTDDSRTGQFIAQANGSSTQYRMVRTFGFGALAFVEGIGAVNTNKTMNVYLNGVLQSPSGWTLDATNSILILDSAPAEGITITADFWFYYLCRFIEDVLDTEQFMSNRWRINNYRFRSVMQ